MRIQNTNKGHPDIQTDRRTELLGIVRNGTCAKAVAADHCSADVLSRMDG